MAPYDHNHFTFPRQSKLPHGYFNQRKSLIPAGVKTFIYSVIVVAYIVAGWMWSQV